MIEKTKIYFVQELLDELRITRRTFERRREDLGLPPEPIPGLRPVRFLRADMEEWWAGRRWPAVEGASEAGRTAPEADQSICQ